jgi:hypothetical protein
MTNLLKLLASTEKELLKAKKEFAKCNKVLSRFDSLGWENFKTLPESRKIEYSKASADYQKYDRVITALITAKEKIESANKELEA